ncbi:MAG: hypothetical protein JW757_02070 [Anaerolineales bacterium]|nr:hypothetical protein [Anaerolineales bacterium]
MTTGFLLTLLSGLAWTIVYIDGIRIGIKDKSFAMPLWPLGLNLAWELLYFLIGVQHAGFTTQVIINLVWFLFDLGLVYTYFRYGRKYFPKNINPVWFTLWGILVVAVGFIVQYAFILEFETIMAGTYAAYLQNLLMSVLFIHMLVQRGSREGQTMLIAVSKLIGSLAPTIAFGLLGVGAFSEPQPFVLVIGSLMAFFDLIYIVMLAKTRVDVCPAAN